MDKSVGLLLEGGAMRSIFSAGVLDYLLEKEVKIPNVLAISAGAYAGMNYASGQKGRVIDAVIRPLKEYRYLGPWTFLRKGTFFDMEYLFKEVPQKKCPYDFKAFRNFDGRFIVSTVNCVTGETVYHEDFPDEDTFFNICQAANSLPLIARITEIDGSPMLDGGIADAIPVWKALDEGWDKLVVVFTRDASYRKKPRSGLYIKMIRLVYRKYPRFLQLIENRSQRYNDALDKVAELEREGKAFVLRPTKITVGNSEANVDKLMKYYRHGYDTAARQFEDLKKFLEN